ncbi:hypothetical protein [Mycobacterium leprae]
MQLMLSPARRTHSVAVIETGPAELGAAVIITQRGHQIILYQGQ